MFFKPKKVVQKFSEEATQVPYLLQTKIGMYPGTFDPITKGHVDLIERSLMLVHDLVIAVVEDDSSNKDLLFTHQERVEMVKKDIAHLDQERIKVVEFSGLLVNFARKHGATRVIRGLRAVSDFEYEMQMAFMNKRLAADIVTVFLPAAEETQFVSSRMVKEIARMGGNVNDFVSENVRRELDKKYNSNAN